MMIIIVRSAHWFRIIVFISANINHHHHHSFLIATRIKCIYMYLPRLEKNSSVELKFTLFQSKDLAVCWSDGNLSSNYQQVLRRGEGPGHNDLIHVSINCQNCNYFSAQFVCVCLCGRQLPSWATNDNHWSELLVAPGSVQLWLEPFQSLYREWGICGKTDTQQRAVFYEHS